MEKTITATHFLKEELREDIRVEVTRVNQIPIQKKVKEPQTKKEKKECKNCKGACCTGDQSSKIHPADTLFQNKETAHEEKTALL